ncbi:MAG TPA: cytochrome c oxidase assembly protein [Steroidobacteraceae bacterium]|nr:cytochrome c oxidase assembly protein [Steroidobacteraceae bacterium]
MSSSVLLTWLRPWEISWIAMATCCTALLLFFIGGRAIPLRSRPSIWRQLSFYCGLVLVYAALQTRLDFAAQHMFWVHRLQHLILHHLGPFLICLAAPWPTMANGLPWRCRPVLKQAREWPPIRTAYRLLQQPIVAPVIFVGLIYFWLWPPIHFRAMLNAREYLGMNWSMLIDGMLFWWLILDPRSVEEGARCRFGFRIAIVLLAAPPQILIGAYLFLHLHVIYDVYAICGRLWAVDPIVDQQIGGLITWIPTSMMSIVATLIVWRRWMYEDDRTRKRAADPGGAVIAAPTA